MWKIPSSILFIGLFIFVRIITCIEFFDAEWSVVESSGVSPLNRFQHTAILTKDEKMVIFAGIHEFSEIGTLNDVVIYDTVSNTWKNPIVFGNRPQARRRHSAILTDEGTMIIFGGLADSGSCFNDVGIYNIANSTWLNLQPIDQKPLPRQAHVAIYTSRKTMLIFGGIGASQFFNDVWEFDLINQKWKQLNPSGEIPDARAFMASTVIGDNWYIFGGVERHGGYTYYLNELLHYDIKKNIWLPKIDEVYSPAPRAQLSMVTLNNRLVLVGGYDVSYLHEVDLIDFSVSPPEWGRVLEYGNFPIKGIECHTTVVVGNRILVYGGEYEGINNPNIYSITVTKSR